MPSHHDYVISLEKLVNATFYDQSVDAHLEIFENRGASVALLQQFVCSVREYALVDPDWNHIDTAGASRARAKMYADAREIMLQVCGENLSDEDLNDVFGWSYDE